MTESIEIIYAFKKKVSQEDFPLISVVHFVLFIYEYIIMYYNV